MAQSPTAQTLTTNHHFRANDLTTLGGADSSGWASGANVVSAHADDAEFTTLYTFEAPAANTFISPMGSQPDTRPVLGPDGAVYGMTVDGGQFGNGVIYRFDLDSHQYTVLYTFSAMDANGDNADGASPGVALTAGPGGVFYGMASLGGANGKGLLKRAWKGDLIVE